MRLRHPAILGMRSWMASFRPWNSALVSGVGRYALVGIIEQTALAKVVER
jgi:hypothetical protein